MIFIFNLMDK